jgi:phosphoribosylanthranilate isomerase
MTVVKVCGIRSLAEGRVALEAGASMLGFVLWPGSKRHIAADGAASIIRQLRLQALDWSAVGVFVDPSPAEASAAAQQAGLDYVQLSGNESRTLVAAMPRPVIKALHVRPGQEAQAGDTVGSNALGAELYLLDTHADGHYGGTGQQFDWQALRAVGGQCLVAGGLRPDNVAAALQTLSPRGVDVSSGVEFPSGGKDPRLIRAFLEAVRTHDSHSFA